MEESSGEYSERLRAIIDEKRTFISQYVLGIVSESISEYRKTFEAILSTLIRGGLLNKDIYAGCIPAHKLKLPSSAPIKGKAWREEISIRLSDYLKQLIYLENYYELSLESLNQDKVRGLKDFFGYINWNTMSQSSVSPNEKILVEIENALSAGNDSLSLSVFVDGKNRLALLTSRLICAIEDLSIYLREEYKLEIRDRIIMTAAVTPDLINGAPDEAVLSVKKEFKTAMGEKPFHPVLIKEIFREDYSEQSERLREAVLTAIGTNKTVIEDKPQDSGAEAEVNTKLLLEGFRLLAGAGPALINISEKLNINAHIVEDKRLSFFQRLLLFFRKKPSDEDESRIYKVVIFNPAEEACNSVRINFNEYISNLTEEGQLLLGYGNRSSNEFLRIQKLSAEQLTKELTRHIKILYGCLKKLPLLDLHLRDRANNAKLGSMKGIRLDLNDIQSSIIKSNNRRLEYQTRLSGGFK
ncbi:MAG: hypothetical protein JEZ04_13055 [Spirochaetales bacterium]|nr:hypothetical protein [Spirochaetales bacterium]